ncbi:MAG: FIST C-terminal domain-containing protein [Treponema sp.]|nr:FIST C-terminal domain-containing protein [Treponema sp.]
MIKMLNAFTDEIDDPETAVTELLEQVDPDNKLLANSVGIVHCFSEFLDSGVVKALSGKLPFDVVGTTTMSLSTSSFISDMGLSLTVLTSDTVKFISGVSAPINDSVDGPLAELYNGIAAAEKPSLLMPFIPFMITVGGDEFIEKLDSLSGGIPAFGTLAISNEPDYSKSYTIYKGRGYAASMVLLALVGCVDPVFLSVSVNKESILKQKAVITGINRNILQTINNIPAVTYLESTGLVKDNDVAALASIPFVIQLEDGSTLIRAVISSTGDGGVILCGAAPVNSTLALALMSQEEVIASTAGKVQEALEKARGRGILMYSCAGRNWVLGVQILAEHEKVKECIGSKAPYYFVYSGGEIFPSFLDNGSVVNHLQNDSLIICIL